MPVEEKEEAVKNRRESRRKYEQNGRAKTGTTHASLSVRVKIEEAQEVRQLLSALKAIIRSLNSEKRFKENLEFLVEKLGKKTKPSTPEAADPEAEAFSTLQKLPG